MSKRPRRHIIVNSGFPFTTDVVLNFAWDEDSHTTRILRKASWVAYRNVVNSDFATAEDLYKPEKIDKAIAFYEGEYYCIEQQVSFNRTHYLYRAWWDLAADIGCVYDLSSKAIRYVSISAWCKALQCHTLAALNQLNCVCLSQVWARSCNDKITQCSMSFCTGSNQKYICKESLGEATTQDTISRNTTASRYLNLCIGIVPLNSCSSLSIKETDYVKTIITEYDESSVSSIVCLVYAYTEKEGINSICKDAEGWLDLSYYGCRLDQSRVYLREGQGYVRIERLPHAQEFSMGVTSFMKDAIRIVFKSSKRI